MGEVNKAIMAILGGIATVVSQFAGFDIPPTIIATVGAVITTALVYLVPNKPKDEDSSLA